MNLENSLFNVSPKSFTKNIIVPTSKSYANRALILGAVRGSGFTISNISESSDVVNLLFALSQIGIKYEKVNNQIKFNNSFPECESLTIGNTIDLKTGDGGTTNRFLIALLSRGKKEYRIFPSEKISQRPIEDLLLPLKELGVQIEMPASGPWLIIKGPANISTAKKITIDCSKSTQFASAMLLAFNDIKISILYKNLKASETYLRMTESMIKENTFIVPADFSSLSYPVALALIDGNVLVQNCNKIDSYQADSVLIELMKKWGADFVFSNEGLIVSSKNILKPFMIDGSTCPDLVPTLAFLASKIEGESHLENLEVLRHKESDRINELLEILKAFEVDHTFENKTSTIIINGSKKLAPPVTYTPARDHRMVMTTYLFMRANSGGNLGNTDCVEKSYPNFFRSLEG
jgi:3-phosphoshikimate 1-carboxyvinyltransferase